MIQRVQPGKKTGMEPKKLVLSWNQKIFFSLQTVTSSSWGVMIAVIIVIPAQSLQVDAGWWWGVAAFVTGLEIHW